MVMEKDNRSVGEKLDALATAQKSRLAHTARPDAGDDVDQTELAPIKPATPALREVVRLHFENVAVDEVERVAIVRYLRNLAKNSREAHAEYAKLGEDDEVLDRWVARVEDYAFVADQIERGVHNPAAIAAMREGVDRGMVVTERDGSRWMSLDEPAVPTITDATMRAALQDIADAEAIPNDAVAFLWCREVARAALSRKEPIR